MYLRNSWYVACWARELLDKPLARVILNEHVVFFRTQSGKPMALEDRCSHRHLPLHLGAVVGENIRCGYHGTQFDGAGRCVAVPSQKLIPPKSSVRSYPIVERHSLIWLWTGDPDKAEAASIPDFSKLSSPDFAAVGTTNHVKASHELVIDNLMDLSHVGFVHTSTIGNTDMGANGRIKVVNTESGVRVTRWVIDCAPPPTYVKTGRLPPGVNIDRWQIIDFVAPSFVIIHAGGAETGTGAPEGKLSHGLNLWILNAMTPAVSGSTLYFWAAVRDYGIGNTQVDELIFNNVAEAFAEDKAVLEAQQEVIARHGDSWANAFQADTGSVKARRFVQRMIEAEEKAHGQTATPEPVPG